MHTGFSNTALGLLLLYSLAIVASSLIGGWLPRFIRLHIRESKC